jgi:GT2 family glycosyltransferase
MSLSIIIVNWNVKDLLEKCLASIFQHTQNIDFEVIVVDNNSFDGSAEMIAKNFPAVKLITNHRNAGFAYANNQALKEARGRYLLFLNPDTELIDNNLETAVRLMDQNPDWSIFGCQLLNSDLTIQPSVRRFPKLLDQVLVLLKIQRLPWFKKFLKNYLMVGFNYERESLVDQVMGAYFFTRRETIDKIGLFDNKFHLWFEEVDFCQRAKLAGLKIIYSPACQIIHRAGESFRQLDWHKQLIWNNSLQHYFWKHRPKWQWLIIWIIEPISVFLAFLAWLWRR